MGLSLSALSFSDHFRYASSFLSDFLAKFFTVMLRHGHILESLRDCVYLSQEKIHAIQTAIDQLPWPPLLAKFFNGAYYYWIEMPSPPPP